jgi:Zn-dependent M28 family amino/carboxypeptidase
VLILLITILISCGVQKNVAESAILIKPQQLLDDVTILASDSFLGRKPFTPGETRTVDFLVNRFKQIGTEPGNDSSFVQDVPLVEILAQADSFTTISGANGNFHLRAFSDYVMWTNKTDSLITLDNTPIVFAGFGVVAPEYSWNDYAGLDVRNKLVLVMVNDPGFWNNDTSLFKGRAMTYYGRWTYKFEEAARQGAKGCLVIHRTSAAGYPFTVVQAGFNTTRLQLGNRSSKTQNCDVIGWITDTAAVKLLQASGFDETYFQKANQRGFKAVELPLTASTNMHVKARYDVSKNVIAKITGSKRPDEVIIYTAHWDHLGIGVPDATGDSIYNGALDNATGTAGLLELARAFRAMKTPPERTVVFLSVTAEEQGLLGSAYYAEHPVYPPEKTVANINMDVLNTYGETKDLVVVGMGQSELEDYLKAAAEKRGGYIVDHSRPETGSYFRSDHFNFAKIGIPALYQGSGIDLIGKGKEAGQKLRDEYTARIYHRPSDEVDPLTWKLEGAARDLQILYDVGKQLAFESRWPQWKKESEFRAIREASNEARR